MITNPKSRFDQHKATHPPGYRYLLRGRRKIDENRKFKTCPGCPPQPPDAAFRDFHKDKARKNNLSCVYYRLFAGKGSSNSTETQKPSRSTVLPMQIYIREHMCILYIYVRVLSMFLFHIHLHLRVRLHTYAICTHMYTIANANANTVCIQIYIYRYTQSIIQHTRCIHI